VGGGRPVRPCLDLRQWLRLVIYYVQAWEINVIGISATNFHLNKRLPTETWFDACWTRLNFERLTAQTPRWIIKEDVRRSGDNSCRAKLIANVTLARWRVSKLQRALKNLNHLYIFAKLFHCCHQKSCNLIVSLGYSEKNQTGVEIWVFSTAYFRLKEPSIQTKVLTHDKIGPLTY